MKKSLLFVLLCLVSLISSRAQTSTFPCGFDIVHKQKLLSDKSYDSAVRQLDERWKTYSAIMSSAMLTYTTSGYVYEIPMVIHVLHTGGAVGTTYNPDSSTLAGMVEYLNKSYAAVSPFPDTTTGSSGGGTRIPLKFVLAKRTPAGVSTNGIIRINASTTLGSTYTTYGINAATTTGVTVSAVTALSRWNFADYYNVYVVNKIDGNDLTSTGGIAGFAYFPGSPTVDGMYVVASQAKTGSTVVSHEFGHAFSLYHTFEGDAGGTTCPSTTSCSTTGDLVCDTEPHIRESSAFPSTWCPPTDVNSCTGLSYNKTQFNIMDYTQCPPNRFTAGQRTRVLNTLDNERVGYKTSSGLLDPAGTITSACTPTASNPGYPIGPYIVEFNDMKVWTGSAGDENANYVDHSYTQQSTVTAGTGYTINVTTRVNAQNVKAFIDYNNDGDFLDAGEEVFSHGYTVSSGTEVHSGTITIPSSGVTTCTYLRMRVVAEFAGSTITNWSCGPYDYGQAEDYAINIATAPSAPTVTTPVNYCVGASSTALTATGTGLLWYTAATGGTGSATAPTPSTATAGSTIYYVSQTSGSCESSRAAITVNINALPTISGTLSACVGGSAVTLTGSGTPDATTPWASSATGVVTISSTGVVSIVGAGTSTITYKTSNGCTKTATFTVNALPTISGTLSACVGGSSVTLTGSGTPDATTPWASSATGVVTISSTGVVSIVGAGTSTITYKNNNGCTQTATFTVNALPTISGTLSACVGGSSVTLTGSGTPDATTPWASSATGVVTISSTGVVSIVGAGTSTITYKTSNGCTKTATFTVNALPTISGTLSACVGGSSVTLIGSGTPDATTPWASSATGVVTISSTGVVSIVGAGTSTITYKNNNGCTQTATFTVNALPTISGTLSACVGGSSVTLTGSGTPDATTPWTSSATGVVTISSTGVVSIVGAGTSTITYKNNNGCSQTATFTVNALPTISGTLSTTISSTSTLTGSGTAHPTTPWTSSSTAIATVSSTGVVTGVSGGTTTITYKNSLGCEKSVTFTVLSGGTISGVLSACVGATSTLTGAGTPHATTPWTSSSTSVATVSGTGVVTGVAAGTCTITYKNNLGVDDIVTFTVYATPTAPTVSTPVTYCQGATALALTATKSSASDTLLWYTVASGGTATTTAPTPSTAAAGTTNYYVSEKNTSNCESSRTLIAVTVNAAAAAPAFTSPVTYCQDATSVSALSATGTSIKWYTVATGGTASTTAPTPSSTTPGITNYYVTQSTGLGCETYPRSFIEVVINPKPANVTATAASATELCIGDSVVLNGSASVFTNFGNTAYLQGSYASGSPFACDCPNGSVVVGYEGSTGALIDQFRLICKPIDRFGVLGSTTTPTSYNGNAAGPVTMSPTLFSGTGMFVGIKAIGTTWPGPGLYTFLGGITGYGQNQSYIDAYGDNSSSPLTLASMNGWSSSGDYGTVFTPKGTVSIGMYSYSSFYARGVSLRYTPIGAFKYTYSWSSAPTTDTNSSVTIKSTGNYTLTVTNSLGCSATSTPVNVNVYFFPGPPTVSGPVQYCLGGTAVPLTATKSSATDTLYWYTTATGGVGTKTAPTPSTSTPGSFDYFVSEKNPAGCESARTMITVLVDSAVTPFQIVTTDSMLCLGESTLLRTGTSLKDSLNAAYTGGFLNDGIMFDIKAKNSITITGIDMAMGSVPSTASLSVYYKTGAYSGYEGTSSAWILLGSVLPTPGLGGFYNIPVPMSVNVMDGQTVAFYLAYNSTGTVLYSTGTSVGNPTNQDANMQVLDGRGVFAPLFGGAATPRAFAGKIRYNKFSAVWSTSATTDTITVAPTTTTKYWARITNWLGCNATDTIEVQVNSLPTISGTLSACIGQTSTLSGTATAHPTTPWTSSNTAIATVSSAGVVTGVSAGTVTITYMNSNGCTTTASFTVNPLPTISGTLSACVGLSSTLTGSATPHATTPWTSSNTSVATVSSTGVVTAVSAGTTTITYRNTNGCTQTATFTVNPLPTIGLSVTETSGVAANDAIVCSGNSYTINATGGGTYLWKLGGIPFGGTGSSMSATTTTGATTVLTFRVIVTSGLGCVDSASQSITVNPLPGISGTLNACVGTTSTLTGTATPHATTPWTSSNTAVATVSSTGVVTGVSAGTTTITYLNSNGCTTSATFTVNALPSAPTVTSPVTYCQDATASSLSATGTSLKWYSAASGGTGSTTATIPSTSTPGIFAYYVTQTNALGCESLPRTAINVVINPKPVSVTITPATSPSFCIGDSVILDGSASVFSGFGNTPYLNTPSASGTIYTCDCPNGYAAVGYEGRTGSWMDRFNLICKKIDRLGVLGSTTATTATNGSSGGGGYNGPYLFTGTNLMVGATVKAEGVSYINDVTGFGQSLSYILGVGDNTASAVTLSTLGGGSPNVNLGTVWAPNGSVITGMYSYPTFYSSGVSFRYTPIGAFKYTYVWSTSATDTNSSITVKTSGAYTLTVTNSLGCSATSAPLNVTVNPLPTISGILNTCVGQTSALTGSATAHPTTPWSSSNTAVATVSSTGVVTGVSAGTVTITYMNNNGCVITASFVVNPLPTISGTLSACVGQTSTLTGSATAHATTPWTSSVTSVATVSSTGVVTGVSAGTTVITYRNTNGCTQNVTFTVNPLPTISGTLNACIGSSSTLTGSASPDATTPWTSSVTSVATVSSSGVVSALSVGTTVITYKNNNGCTQTATFTVNPLPTISGTLNTCIGSTSTLTGSATAHATTPWISSNTSIATVSSTGVVTGVSAGTVTITYMNTNGCVITASFTVNPLPTISGTLVACVGQTSTLTGSATAHATTPWTSSATSVATVSSTGVVTGVSGGTTIITYRNTNGCTQTATFTVNPLPTITGTLSACVGQSSTLTGSATPDATAPWTSSNTSVATVSSVGVVSGLSAGTTTISYKNSNGCIQTATFTVNPLPLAPTVTSPVNLCIGVPASALTASGSNLKWYTVAVGGTSSSTAPIPSTTALGTTNYYVSQTNTFGCEGPRALIAVTVQPSPVVSISSLSPYGFIFCKNLTVTLKANSATAVSWQWDTTGVAWAGRTFDTVAAGKVGKWGVTVANIYGCKNRAEVDVYQDTTKAPVLSPTSISICEEGSALLTCSPGFTSYTFEWIKDGIFIVPPTLKENLKNASLPGIYTVRVTNNYGCIDTTNTTVVTYYPKPLKPVITNLDPVLEVPAGYVYYQWYRNNAFIPGANSRTYLTTSIGDYFVVVTDENGCLNNSDTISILQSSSISNSVTKTELKIYPNPTKEIVYIESPISITVRVTDVVGRVVFEAENPKSVSLANLADGTYFFRISDENDRLITVEKVSKVE
jgi:trimeric autotransporter adhesin